MLSSRIAPLLVAATLLALPLRAEAPATYADLAKVAKQRFAPVGAEEVETRREEAAAALAEVDRLVPPGTALGAGWNTYLGLGGLRPTLAPGVALDARAARRVMTKLGSGAEGLERAPFGRLADSLERLITTSSFAGARDQRAVFDRQADLLAELLGQREKLATARGGYQAERRLLLLSGIGRAEGLLDAARDAFGEPNLHFEATAELLSQLASRDVDRTNPVTDCILGTSIRGTGHTVGRVRVTPIESDSEALVLFSFDGTTDSLTIGKNGPISIRSAGNTHFSATKLVRLSDAVFASEPARATATTRTRTLGVWKTGGGIGRKLIAKIGRKRVDEKRPQVDRISGRNAARRIEAGFDGPIDERIADFRSRYNERLGARLRQRRIKTRSIDFSSTDDAVRIAALLASDSQLAAPGEPPACDSPLSMRVHQTAVNNLLATYLDGARLSRPSEDRPASLDVVSPPWAKDREPSPTPEGVVFRPWAIRFRPGRPVSVVFGDDLLTATIHAARIEVGDENFDGWDLIARFRPEPHEGGWRLARVGEIEVMPTGFDPEAGRSMASKDVVLRNNLAKALNQPEDRLPLHIDIEPIDLSDRDGPVDALVVERVGVTDGWLSVGWRAE